MNGQLCPAEGIKTLLVATDGSESCRSAVHEAIKLAKMCSSRLIAVAVVVTNREYEDVLPWVVDEAEREMQEQLQAIRESASAEGVACEIVIHRAEDPYVDIVEEAARNQAAMIIIGTHARTGIKRLLMGRITARVIGHSPCNVLVVPPCKELAYMNILVATDGSGHSAAAASEAMAIAKRCGSLLFVLSVAPLNASAEEIMAAEQNVKQVMELAEKEGIRKNGLVIEGKPHEGIIKTSREKQADLIVVGSHGRTGLMSLLMGSVTGQVIGHADCAILVVKARVS